MNLNKVIGSLAFGQSFDGIDSGKSLETFAAVESLKKRSQFDNQVRNIPGFPLWSRVSGWAL